MEIISGFKNSFLSRENDNIKFKQGETAIFHFYHTYGLFKLNNLNGEDFWFLKEGGDLPVYINLMNSNRFKVEYEVKLPKVNNIILKGYAKNKLFLKGNKNNNVLDSGMMNASINGYGGNDRLIFSSGVARGGDGDDYYYLRRYQWLESKNITKLNARIVERSKGKSEVHLEYSLKEIVNVEVVNNDLVMKVEVKSPENSSKVLKLNVTLQNVYQDHYDEKMINHCYQLYTNDGFCLKPILNSSYNKKTGKFFEISYLQDKDHMNKSDKVKINKEKEIILINEQGYASPTWGAFNFNGDMKNLVYIGSDYDDQLEMTNKNSHIMVTKGNDMYKLKPDSLILSELTIDFSGLEGNAINESSIIINLVDENGRDLHTDGKTIYFKNRFNDKKLNINFINYEKNKVNLIYIKDAHENLFKVKLSTSGHEIKPPNITTSFTQQADEVYLRAGLIYPAAIIDALSGDDIIYNYSGLGVIVNGGNGDDLIKTGKGLNVLYGGNGDDTVFGGEQGDLLLSDLGNDNLNGNEGDDQYIVDGSKGVGKTIINDIYGINEIHLMHFNKEQKITEENGIKYQVYISKTNLREVKIQMPDQGNKNNVHHYDKLPHNIPNDVKESMSHMVRYLAEHKQYWQREKMPIPWQPMYAFKDFFTNTSYDFIDVSKPKIEINQKSEKKQLFINLKGQHHDLNDSSGHGRVFKAEMASGKLAITSNATCHNVLYAGEGHIDLQGGAGNDVFIANGHSGSISDKDGENIFIINGEFRGSNVIHSHSNKDTIHLISFDRRPTIIEADNEYKATRYIYRSESGYQTVLVQHQSSQLPNVIHHNSLAGSRAYTMAQKLEYLVNTMAEMRLQDEYTSIGVQDSHLMNSHWQPAQLVGDYLLKGRV